MTFMIDGSSIYANNYAIIIECKRNYKNNDEWHGSTYSHVYQQFLISFNTFLFMVSWFVHNNESMLISDKNFNQINLIFLYYFLRSINVKVNRHIIFYILIFSQCYQYINFSLIQPILLDISIIQMKSEVKVEVLKNFQCSINEYCLNMQLYSDSFLKITLLSLQSLDYFESKLRDSNVGELYKGIFNETAELYDYTVANIRDAVVDLSGILLLPDTSCKQDNIKIVIQKQTRYKYEALWLKLLQFKKQLGSQLARNGDKDLKRYDQFRSQIDTLKRAGSDDKAKLDNFQKSSAKLKESFDKFSLENKSKLETLDKKISLFKSNIEASQQEDKSSISSIETKVDELKKFTEEKFVQNKNKIRGFDFKILDLEQQLNKVKDQLASKSQFLTQYDDELKCSIDKLKADTKEQIESLEKRLKSTAERIPGEDTTIIIRDYKRASDELKRTMDKFMGDTRANIEALNQKDAQIAKSIEVKVSGPVSQITNLQVKISEITASSNQSQQELRERLKKLEEKSNGIIEGIQKITGQVKHKTESLSSEDSLIRQQIHKINVQLKDLNDFKTEEKSNTAKLAHQSQNLAKSLENFKSQIKVSFENVQCQFKKVDEKCPGAKITLIEKTIEETRLSIEKYKTETKEYIQSLIPKINQQFKEQIETLKKELDGLRCQSKAQIENLSSQIKKLEEKGAGEEITILNATFRELKQTFDKFISETTANIQSLSLKLVNNINGNELNELKLQQTVNKIAELQVSVSEINKAYSQSQSEWIERHKLLEEKCSSAVDAIQAIKSESKSKTASTEREITLFKEQIQRTNGQVKNLNDFKTDLKLKTEKLTQQTEGLRQDIGKLRTQSKGQFETLQKQIKKAAQKGSGEDTSLIIKDQKRIIDELKHSLDKFVHETKSNFEALNIKNTEVIKFMGETNAALKNLNLKHTEIVKRMQNKGSETEDHIREHSLKISEFNKFVVKFEAETKGKQDLSNKLSDLAKKEKQLQTKIESLGNEFVSLKDSVEKLNKESIVIKEQCVQAKNKSPFNKFSILIILIIIGLTSAVTHFLGRSQHHNDN